MKLFERAATYEAYQSGRTEFVKKTSNKFQAESQKRDLSIKYNKITGRQEARKMCNIFEGFLVEIFLKSSQKFKDILIVYNKFYF